VAEPAPQPFVSYGPVQQDGADLTVVESIWEPDAVRLTWTIVLDPATALERSRRTSDVVETFDWTPIAVPPAPQPLCPPPPPPG
jgi:hypothetical protein